MVHSQEILSQNRLTVKSNPGARPKNQGGINQRDWYNYTKTALTSAVWWLKD